MALVPMILPMFAPLHSFDRSVALSGPVDLHEVIATGEALWPTLAPLEAVYPAFQNWYFGKVLPGLATGTRKLIVTGSLDAPIGVAIVKREITETKICTVWVAEDQREAGAGRELLERAINLSGVARPLFTVPAERHEAFKPLLRRFGFVETARIMSLYRPGVVEHVFNGVIRPALHS